MDEDTTPKRQPEGNLRQAALRYARAGVPVFPLWPRAKEPLTAHGFKDAGEEAQLLVEVRPALHLDDYFRVFLGLSRDGRITMPVRGMPHPLLEVALVMERFAPEIGAPGIPLSVQRFAWRLLGKIGRWRGLSASFPEYGAP